jgi:hypothetical protein
VTRLSDHSAEGDANPPVAWFEQRLQTLRDSSAIMSSGRGEVGDALLLELDSTYSSVGSSIVVERRTGPEVALRQVALERGQLTRSLGRLDAFSNGGQAEASSEIDRRHDQCTILIVGRNPDDEALVDLEEIDRQNAAGWRAMSSRFRSRRSRT